MTHQNNVPMSIYVIEEQEFYRNIYQASFSADESFKFLGVSANGDDKTFVQTLESENPDILLVGAKKINENIFHQIDIACTSHPRTSVVILLTQINDIESKMLRRLMPRCRSGVSIYLKQSLDSTKQLHDIIQSVHRGQIVLDPAVANSILMEKIEYPFMKQLTERELEILNLLSQGCTNSAIAKNLCIDIKTVAHHLNNIYSKLKEDDELDLKHPRVSVARIYLETTGELMPYNARKQATFSLA
jgi:DNA-binding NarL/FixJ family response regulator